jgi:hypothetical protein
MCRVLDKTKKQQNKGGLFFMNMKKTLAGLMAGVVAISAMATVAVSAKAQKADECTWSTMAVENTSAETIVYVVIAQADQAPAWEAEQLLELNWKAAAVAGTDVEVTDLEIVEITKITNRKGGNATVEDEDLARLYDVVAGTDGKKNTIKFATNPIDALAEVELAIKVKAPVGFDIAKNSVEVADASTIAGEDAATATNVKKDADTTKKGVLLNIPVGETNESFRNGTYTIRSLDQKISLWMKGDEFALEPTEEIADFLKDAKGATIAFNFAKEDIDDSVSDNEFDEWHTRYEWNADTMKSAISLRINNSNVLSVDMMEFDKATFSAVYSWDEVMAKFQVGSATGLVNEMGLKINNEKLPAKKDKAKEVIDLRLNSITVKIPEMAETEDDSMVEDFAAGESATVVEDTLPAATDAPAADAPAADAPATTDAAANPSTGNSAVALAVIPVAIAAAAFVAKKRG